MNYRKDLCPIANKVCFDKKTAMTKRNSLLRMGREKFLRVYQCGDHFHITKDRWFNGKKYE